VIGVTGSGKTTMAANLACALGLTHVELDALNWEANWISAPLEVFCSRVAEALQAPGWVTDGNYSRVRDTIWRQADTVVWLDYPFLTCFWRLLRRSVRRTVTKETLWNDNRETLRSILFERDAIIPWLFKSYPRRRREYPQLLALPEYAHLQWIRLRAPRQAESWFRAITVAAGGGFDSRAVPD